MLSGLSKLNTFNQEMLWDHFEERGLEILIGTTPEGPRNWAPFVHWRSSSPPAPPAQEAPPGTERELKWKQG